MNKRLTAALLGATFALAACGGGTDEATTAETDAMAPDSGAAMGDTTSTMTGPNDTTSAAGAGAETGAMNPGDAGAGMDPGGAGDTGATAEEDAAAAGGAMNDTSGQ